MLLNYEGHCSTAIVFKLCSVQPGVPWAILRGSGNMFPL